MFKRAIHYILNLLGYEIHRCIKRETSADKKRIRQGIPDEEFYTPLFSPWEGYGDFCDYYSLMKPYTLVSSDRCYVILKLAEQALHLPGCWFECGVYKGGTAMLLSKALESADTSIDLHLFDTFEGMPETDSHFDLHDSGDFSDTSLEQVKLRVLPVAGTKEENVHFHSGHIPETFRDLSVKYISFAHVDVDIYNSILDCCEFIYPRLTTGGFIVFDDYGFPTCPGARKAVDEFFIDKLENPIVLPTGQAFVMKAPIHNQ